MLLLPHLVPGVSLKLCLSLETRRQVLTRLPPLPVPFSLPKPALWSPEAGSQLTHSAAQARLGTWALPYNRWPRYQHLELWLCASLTNSPEQSHCGRNKHNRKHKCVGTVKRGVFSLTGTVTRGWRQAHLVVSHCTFSPFGWLPKGKRTHTTTGGLKGQRGAF